MFDEAEKSYLKIEDILKGIRQLEDKFEIEDVLIAMQSYAKKQEFLKELKRKRIEAIDQQLDEIDRNISILQNAITQCMNESNEKTLDFPGIAKISVRKTKGTWNILNQDALFDFLKAHKMEHGLIESTWKFKKKELNKLLDELQTNNNVPDSVMREENKQSLSVSYDKQEKNTQQPVIKNVIQSNDDFDKIGI